MIDIWHWLRNTDLGLRAWGWNHPFLVVVILAAIIGLGWLSNKINER